MANSLIPPLIQLKAEDKQKFQVSVNWSIEAPGEGSGSGIEIGHTNISHHHVTIIGELFLAHITSKPNRFTRF